MSVEIMLYISSDTDINVEPESAEVKLSAIFCASPPRYVIAFDISRNIAPTHETMLWIARIIIGGTNAIQKFFTLYDKI